MSNQPISEENTLLDRYIALAVQRVQVDREITDILIQLGWNQDPIRAKAEAPKPAILQSELFGFVRVMLGMMDVKYQHAIMGPDRVLNGGGPETPEKPDKPDKPGRADRPDRTEGVPQELIDRDRQWRDRIKNEIMKSPLPPEEKQRAIDAVEAHHRECRVNAKQCLH